MTKIYILYLFTFLAYEFKFFPININDIAGILLGIYALALFLFKKNSLSNIHTLSFLNKDFKYILYSGLLIIFSYFIFSQESLFVSTVKAIRILYFYLSLFMSIYIMNESIIFAEKKVQNLSKLIRIIVYTSFFVLFSSIFYSFIAECKIQYGGSFCFLNQSNYSANGYIPTSLFFINIILLKIIENYNIRFQNFRYLKYIIFFNIASSLIITTYSGSRGALTTFVVTLISLNFGIIKNLFKLKFTKFTVFFILLTTLIFSTKIEQLLELRSFSYIVNPNFGSDRFGLQIFKQDSIILGIGNFNLVGPFSPSNFDGTLRLFTISYGLVGLIFILFLLYFFIKKLILLRKKLLITKNFKSINILYSVFIYTVTFSIANENIIINGVSIIFLFSMIMPLMLLNYLSNKLRVKDYEIK